MAAAQPVARTGADDADSDRFHSDRLLQLIEGEDETATDAATFEGTVRRSGIRGGKGLRDAQGDLRPLGQHAKAVELVGRVGVVGHPHVADRDTAFGMYRRGAALAGTTHDGDLTTVAQRGHHLVALQCSVDDGRDTVGVEPANPFSHIGSSRDDLVGAERGDELLVGRGGVGDHPEPVGLSPVGRRNLRPHRRRR